MGRKGVRFTRRDLVGYVFVTPALLAVLIFFFYSSAQVLIDSFYKMRGFKILGFFGVNNYLSVLTDSLFWNATFNTLYMGVLSLVVGLPFSLVIATLIKESKWGKNFFKAYFFIPNLTSLVAAALLFSFILYPTSGGLLNSVLKVFGIKPLLWFSSPTEAPLGIVMLTVWRDAGYNAIIWLVGLLAIPAELYEAAEIDGASKFRQWVSITIPQLRPIFIFLFMTGTIFQIGRFSDVFVVGGIYGSPASSLDTLTLYIYRQFEGEGLGDFGIASAASVLMFVLIMLLTLLNMFVFSTREGRYDRRQKRLAGTVSWQKQA